MAMHSYQLYSPHLAKMYRVDLTLKGQQIKEILEYCYAHIEFSGGSLSLTIVDETLCTFWQGVDYTIDMNALPFESPLNSICA
jgi:2',3'-cyclic-nucleotide 2'-phosphodiesterase/3'-nucleotidase